MNENLTPSKSFPKSLWAQFEAMSTKDIDQALFGLDALQVTLSYFWKEEIKLEWDAHSTLIQTALASPDLQNVLRDNLGATLSPGQILASLCFCLAGGEMETFMPGPLEIALLLSLRNLEYRRHPQLKALTHSLVELSSARYLLLTQKISPQDILSLLAQFKDNIAGSFSFLLIQQLETEYLRSSKPIAA